MADVKPTTQPTEAPNPLAAIVQMQAQGHGRGERVTSVAAIIAGLGVWANKTYSAVLPQAKGPDSASKSAVRYNRIKAGNTVAQTVQAIYADLIAAGASEKYALSECAKTRADIANDTLIKSYYQIV